MNLSLRHVSWAIGFIAGCVVGVSVAPSWELAPIFIGFVAGVTGALTAQITAVRLLLLPVAVLATVASSMVVLQLIKANPTWVVHRCVTAVFAAGLLGIVLGSLTGHAKRQTRRTQRRR